MGMNNNILLCYVKVVRHNVITHDLFFNNLLVNVFNENQRVLARENKWIFGFA